MAAVNRLHPNLEDGRRRVVIEHLSPSVDCGRYPAKRTIGERIRVEADIFADGHDLLASRLLVRKSDEGAWAEVSMTLLGNDRWQGVFDALELGFYEFTVVAWVDHFLTWRRDLEKRAAAGERLDLHFLIGASHIDDRAALAGADDRERLESFSARLRGSGSNPEKLESALSETLLEVMDRTPDRRLETRHEPVLRIEIDRVKARFSSWYELFPRSASATPGEHGTLRDVEARLPSIAKMGFDVLYLPPIHPIGSTHRKGKNNSAVAGPDDVGSPWAIGNESGGHTSIHPELGTLDDFRSLIVAAQRHGIELALDIAFQASPDHPWVKEHPEWFLRRPDNTVQFAENPPKKYQDIYPFHFESEAWEPLWQELKNIFLFWIGEGIRIFRVDNPHTKPLPFWEWVIRQIKNEHPDVIFLSESFTRPRVMYSLAKMGFTQSYTYFTWRNTKYELTEYFRELSETEVREYFRPNLWPNSPDILPEFLQHGGRPAFLLRLILAATLSPSYGIYGPAYELLDATPRMQGTEEYLDSEKYELRHWNLDAEDSISELIARMNSIRRNNGALQEIGNLRFHPIDNEQMICYSKTTDDGKNQILVVANLDPYAVQGGTIDLRDSEIEVGEPIQLHDLLTGARYTWRGRKHHLQVNPLIVPAFVFRVRRRVRTEADFEYFI